MKSINTAYLKSPTIKGDHIVFVTDDDLWSVSRFGGRAIRLTNSHGMCFEPHISPDGTRIAYLSNANGQFDIYLIPIEGGIPERLTYKGVNALTGWKNNSTLSFASNSDTFSPRVTFLYEKHVDTRKETPVNLGHAKCLIHDGKKRILGRNIGDPARWKRYRGGTAGTLWIDEQGQDNFKKLLPKIKSNLSAPKWINQRVFFISDHEGIGNIYSVATNGRGMKRHTHCEDYYVRSFDHDNGLICYQSGAELFLLELKSGISTLVEINVPSSFNQSTTRIEHAEEFLQEFTLSEDANEIAIITRGQIYHRSPWGGAPLRKGKEDLRYKLPLFLKAKKGKKDLKYLFAVELNEENEETTKIFELKEGLQDNDGKTLAQKNDWGKILEVKDNADHGILAISNNRNDLFLLEYPSGRVEKIQSNKFGFYEKFNWSPCGRYLAFSQYESRDNPSLYLYDLKTKKSQKLLESVLYDFSPAFSPDGKYLYFLGIRNFHPIYSETHFEISFPLAVKPFALCLTKDCPSPLDLHLDFEQDAQDMEEEDKKRKSSKVKEETIEETKIDFDDIEQRVIALPVPLGGYRELNCIQDKVFLLKHVLSGDDGDPTQQRMPSPKTSLYTYCFKERKLELFHKACESFELSRDTGHILLDTEEGVRLVATDAKPSEGDEANRKDGFLQFENIKLSLNPKKEWRQMYQEAWILQREHFWSADMNKVNWQKVYKDYLPLLDKVHTRSEFSDLMWEMQGELGTSHCYEFGGDYFRRPFSFQNGHLGATLDWNSSHKSFVIKDLVKGDSWIIPSSSPLTAPGVSLKAGDHLVGIDGRSFTKAEDLAEALEGRSSVKVNLLIKRKGSSKIENVSINPSRSNHLARYRDWVNANKEEVHKLSKGKVGYVHIPDMGLHGFSEFYRNFLKEHKKEGLVVDVRYNGGGHISQHILKILAQKLVGFDKTRHMDIEPYPTFAVNGPIVALTNEHAGSDGDIFSHSFKLMNIGTLVGTRTWGGVVGIWPRHPLNDGTITSQPEFSFWFKDVGYNVENYGTDPDIEVERLPKDWKMNKDNQLEVAVKEVLKQRVKNPPLKPNLNQNRPNLKAPRLPKV
ncbi:MAG: PDZ domain-containing protein [Bacteriovoracaceae bacterium]|nr:PDZ domain-containing protein [Bacteriovoracaceae bacterium]